MRYQQPSFQHPLPLFPSPAGAGGGAGGREDDGHQVSSEGPMGPTTLSPGDGGEGNLRHEGCTGPQSPHATPSSCAMTSAGCALLWAEPKR